MSVEHINELSSVLVTEQTKTENAESSPFIEDNDFNILDEFVRFDLTRTGAICCTGYKISVQYDDDFMSGSDQSGLCSNVKRVGFFSKALHADDNSLKHKESPDPLFYLEYKRNFWWRREKRRYTVKSTRIPVIGYIECTNIETKLHNTLTCSTYTCKKIRVNTITIENSRNEKVGFIETFRDIRGVIKSYGISSIDDTLSAESKAIFVSGALTMDIEEKGSELRCNFLWTPLISCIFIFVFVVLPFMYFHDDKSPNFKD